MTAPTSTAPVTRARPRTAAGLGALALTLAAGVATLTVSTFTAAPATAAGDCSISWTPPHTAAPTVLISDTITWSATGTDTGWAPGVEVEIREQHPNPDGSDGDWVTTFPHQLDAAGVLEGSVPITREGTYRLEISPRTAGACVATITMEAVPPPDCTLPMTDGAGRVDATVTAGRWATVTVPNPGWCPATSTVSVVKADPGLRHRANPGTTISVMTPKPGRTLRLTYAMVLRDGTWRSWGILTVRSVPKIVTGAEYRLPGAPHSATPAAADDPEAGSTIAVVGTGVGLVILAATGLIVVRRRRA